MLSKVGVHSPAGIARAVTQLLDTCGQERAGGQHPELNFTAMGAERQLRGDAVAGLRVHHDAATAAAAQPTAAPVGRRRSSSASWHRVRDGVYMAMACDLVVAAESACFLLAFVSLALFLDVALPPTAV